MLGLIICARRLLSFGATDDDEYTMYMYMTCIVKPGLSDHPTVQTKTVVKARWSLEPGPTVSV